MDSSLNSWNLMIDNIVNEAIGLTLQPSISHVYIIFKYNLD